MAANCTSLPLRRRYHGNDQLLVVAVVLSAILSLPINPIAAQSENLPPPVPSGDVPPENSMKVSPTMAIVLICMISVFFAAGCVSVYVRQCVERRMSRSFTLEPDGGVRVGRRRTWRGIDAAVIDSFPTFLYSEVKGLKIGKGVLECAVCLNEFEDEQTLRLLPKCNHVFHPECIDGWLCSHSTCPVCRANLVPKPGESIPPVWIPSRDSVPSSPEIVYSVHNDSIVDIPVPLASANASPAPATPNRNTSRQSTPRREGFTGKFKRSFSTSHVLVRPGDDCERFTLRLPEEVRDNLVRTNLQRTKSCVVFPRARSSRRSYRSRSGGTGRGRNFYERFEGEARPDRWGFSKTPPFFSRAASARSGTAADGGETSAAGGRNLSAAVSSPLNRLFGVKGSSHKEDVEVGERSFQRLVG